MHRRWIAETVGIPEHLLRVVAPDIGGGFGAKMHLYPEELLCAYLTRELKCPLKMVGIAVGKPSSDPPRPGTHGIDRGGLSQ
jgi:CO/xanthine dehydrogenase Mo-binding subunit